MLLHEFGGHALAWRLLGGEVVGFRLFVFGGGWINGQWPPATAHASTLSMLIVQLSGIAVELLVGIPLALLALLRLKGRTARGLGAATASVLIVHALFYLVLCVYYGSGDGGVLFRLLQGRVRTVVLIATCGLTVAGAFVVSCLFSPAMRTWAAGRTRRQGLALIVSGVLAAALLHGVLTAGERILVKDRTYAEIKTPVDVRLKAKALSGFISAYAEENGRAPSRQRIDAVKTQLESRYGQFPIELPLGAAVLAAFMTGFFISARRNPAPADPVLWKDIGLLGSLSTFALALILFLNRL